MLLCRIFCRSAEIFCDGDGLPASSSSSSSEKGSGGGGGSPKKGKKGGRGGGGSNLSAESEALSVCLIKTLPALLERFQVRRMAQKAQRLQSFLCPRTTLRTTLLLLCFPKVMTLLMTVFGVCVFARESLAL
jgi:hypothetical protein